MNHAKVANTPLNSVGCEFCSIPCPAVRQNLVYISLLRELCVNKQETKKHKVGVIAEATVIVSVLSI